MKDKNFQFNNSLSLIAKSSVIVFISLVLSKVFSYIYRIIIARQFGPEIYGLFSLSLMLSGWIIIMAIFGLNEGLLRYISLFRGKKQNNKIRYIFRKSFYLLLITGLIGGVLLFVLSSFISNTIFNEPELTLFLRLFSITIPFSVISPIFLSPLRAYEKIGWRVFISNILTNILHVGFILLFILFGLGVVVVPLSYLLTSFVIFIVSIIVLKKQVPTLFLKPRISRKTDLFKQLLSYSWPLIFVGIIWRIFKWTDFFFIGYFKTAVDVGIYNAAVPIALLLTFSSQLFAQMFTPLIYKEYSKKNIDIVKQLSQQVGKWIFFINLPVLALLIVFPGAFLNILFGEEYLIATNSLRILAFGMMIFSLSEVSIRIINMVGKSRMVLFDIVLVAIINLILNILLIPKYGIEGAAISTSFSIIILGSIFMFQAYKLKKIIPMRRKNLNILMASIISLILLLLFKAFISINLFSLAILTIFFFIFYVFLVFIFKGLDRNDLMILRSFLRRFKK